MWILKVSGEPWLWSIRPEELGLFLKEHSWTLAPNLGVSSDRCGVEFFSVAVK
jgi:hypothetical protein